MHVEREEGTAKFWLDRVRLEKSRGFGRMEIGRFQRFGRGKAGLFAEVMHEYFGS